MKAVRLILMTLGGLTLITIIGLAGAWTYSLSTYSEKINWAKKNDVPFVLNWGGLDAGQPFDVIRSYRSRRNITGDHTDYICLQITAFTPDSRSAPDWVFGAEQNAIIADARRLAFEQGRDSNCFGVAAQADSPDIAAYIWSINLHGRYPAGAEIIFYHRPTSRLLYVSYET